MTPVIPGFDHRRVPVADGVSLNTAVAGSGSPVVLLHGFPQTHLMWRHVATDLAAARPGEGAALAQPGDGPPGFYGHLLALYAISEVICRAAISAEHHPQAEPQPRPPAPLLPPSRWPGR